MIEKYGADTLRLWMYSINQPGESKNFDEKTVLELHRQVFGLLYNVLAFYELYRDKKVETNEQPKSKNILDIWILAKMDELINLMTQNLDNYKLLEPVRGIRDFIGDLSTWYLRRSRERIKNGDKEAKATLYFVLKTLAKLMAPFAPFAAEDIWLKLKNENDVNSVHLAGWPEKKFSLFSFGKSKIIENMEIAKQVVTMALDTRQKMGFKVRQPLSFMSIPYNLPQGFLDIIADEVNIKEVKFIDSSKLDVNLDITPELKQEGDYRELARAIQDMRKKMGLTPSDIISLVVETNEEGKKLIQKFESEIKKTILVSKIEFKQNNGEEIKIDELTFKIFIQK
jgi:isoleucyl-tRNA synthetase